MPIIDTAQVFPETKGIVLTCSGVPSERNTRGTVFWDFDFKTEDGLTYHESVPIWLVGPVFKALQFKEVKPGSYDVEPTLSLGRKLKCDIANEDVKGKIYARIKNPIPIAEGSSRNDEIPF